jgi:DNA polymerase elongation subunit (family B)/predicted RNA-binding Zn-ribbon protein involved in translation (DUF1610 family)
MELFKTLDGSWFQHTQVHILERASLAKILSLDIETAPNIAYTWGLFKQNISLSQIVESGRIMCFAYKWFDEKDVVFYSEWTHSRNEMISVMRSILDEADIVVHYYGSGFDIPTMNKEILQNGLTPPSPYRQIDLYRTVASKFKFVSNKLDYVSQALGLGAKVSHEGFALWVSCMNGDKAAQDRMAKYNKQDVLLLEPLYLRLRPWIASPPNIGALEQKEHVCPSCGGTSLQRRGFHYTNAGQYQRYRCNSCGFWSRTRRTESKVKTLTGA